MDEKENETADIEAIEDKNIQLLRHYEYEEESEGGN